MTSTQHGLLQFTLGLNTRKVPFRNCLATGPDEDTFGDVQALESAGFMAKGARIPGGLTYYHASDAGIAAAKLDFDDFQHLFTAIDPEF